MSQDSSPTPRRQLPSVIEMPPYWQCQLMLQSSPELPPKFQSVYSPAQSKWESGFSISLRGCIVSIGSGDLVLLLRAAWEYQLCPFSPHKQAYPAYLCHGSRSRSIFSPREALDMRNRLLEYQDCTVCALPENLRTWLLSLRFEISLPDRIWASHSRRTVWAGQVPQFIPILYTPQARLSGFRSDRPCTLYAACVLEPD